jgi:predicted transcriptional regulator of viral defense system
MLQVDHYYIKCHTCNILKKTSKRKISSSPETKGKVFSTPDLTRKLGNRMAILRAVNAGELLSLGAGYYSTPNLDPAVAQVIAVAKFYPEAVVSGLSALGIHNLSDERLQKVTVDLPRNRLTRNRLLQARRVTKNSLIGAITMKYFGHPIRIYDVERSLCDAYRFDRGAAFFKALKRYLKKYPHNFEKIAKYDKVLGTRVLRAIQQELADA